MINDANAGCLAEAWADVSLRDAVYLSLSNSVGSAVLIGRRLYLGHNLRSGEVGHTTLVPGGRPCYCGKSGCVTGLLPRRPAARPHRRQPEDLPAAAHG